MAQRSSGLYLHVPFCERKCGYCSFYSIAGHNDYISSWLNALEVEAGRYTRPKISTLYIGGGTPSILTLSEWQRLMNILTRNFDFSGITEATSEANPNTLTPELITFLKDNNFTRISLGIQSMNDSELITLGRIHDSYSALMAMELVKESGLLLSCDLIFGIPEQNIRTWSYSLKKAIEYSEHISCYQLTLEPEVPLAKKYNNSDLNTKGYEFYRYAQYFLPRNNFIQYEISNFSPEGKECRHNISYWNHNNVIALGPSAVSYLDGVRTKNPETLKAYIDSANNNFPEDCFDIETLSPHQQSIELAILSLRTKWGIRNSDLLPEVEAVISSMPDDLFIKTDEYTALSSRGMRLGNSVWSEIIALW